MKTAVLFSPGNLNHMKEAYFYENSPLKPIESKVILANVYQNPKKKKTGIREIREYVKDVLTHALIDNGAEFLLIGEADYFKVITGLKSAEPFLGYVADSLCGNFKCAYIPNYKRMFIDPDGTKETIEYVFSQYQAFIEGNYIEPGTNIIKHSWFPETVEEIKEALNILLHKNMELAVDIEAFDLRHTKAGIGSISFSWDTEGGIAFAVDHVKGVKNPPPNLEVRKLLKDFFIAFENKITFHGITYDNYVLIYQLFMDSSVDNDGLLHGIEHLFKNWDCTKLIAYLSLNSCTRPDLSLKSLAQEFAGNWAVESEEIKDISTLSRKNLLTYNLIDTMSTMYVKRKYEPILDQDDQREIYENIFKPAAVDIVQMQLTGLPIDAEEVKKAREELEGIIEPCLHDFKTNPIIKAFETKLKEEYVQHRNSVLVTKRITIDDADHIVFNPNSNIHLQRVLHEDLELPILDYTKSGAPATGGEAIETLLNYVDEDNKDAQQLLHSLISYKKVVKLLNTIIPAMEDAHKAEDGWSYLYGFFNLGGTVSGRLSSNSPNLQNIPSKGKLASIIKKCFKAPPGWLFVGLDYASLNLGVLSSNVKC